MKAKTAPVTESFDAAELGAMMREMRENLGHDLEFVARDLRIRLVYLEAIEAGRLRDLPGNAYVSGFLRSYSDFLGLEGDEIVRRFKMAGAEISSQPRLHLPSPVEEGRLPTGSILLFAAVIAAAAYGGWYYLSATGKGPIETVASLPKELSGLVNGAKNQTNAKQVAPITPSPAPPSSAPPSSAPPSFVASAPAAPSPIEPSPSETASEAEAPAAESNAAAPTSESVASGDAVPATSSPAEAASTVVPTVVSGAEPATAPETGSDNTAAAAPPSRPMVPEPAVSEPAVSEPAASPRVVAPSAPVVATSAPEPAPAPTAVSVPTAADAETVSQTASATPASDPVSTAPVQASSPVSGGVRIVVRATADSYVAVRTGENEPLFSQLMRPGDSYEVPSGADLMLETGNAGGLQITIGGKRAPPLGPIGQIRRNIPLDADKLMRGLN